MVYNLGQKSWRIAVPRLRQI